MALPRRDPGGSRNVKRPRQVSTAAPHGPVFGGLNPATGPLYGRGDFEAPAKRAARRRVERAQQRLPARPVPRVPVLKTYTPAQRETARTLIHRSVQKQAGGANRTPQSVARVNQELLQDPRTRAQLAGALLAARPSRAQVALQRRLAVRDTVKPGPQRSRLNLGIGPATITVNPHAIGQGLLAATSLENASNGTVGGLWNNALKPLGEHVGGDLVTLGSGTFVGGVAGLKALGEALGPAGITTVPGLGAAGYLLAGRPSGGNFAPAEQLGAGVWKGIKDSSPAALLTGHPGLAFKRWLKHPVIETLNYEAAAGIPGRLGGALARGAGSTTEAAGVRGALARAGSTVRPAHAATNDASAAQGGMYVPRTASRDIIRKGLQVRADKGREPVLGPDGKPITVVDRGRRVQVLKTTADEQAKLNRQRANFDASRANSRERAARAEADQVDRKAGKIDRSKAGRLADDLRVWAVQNVIRTPATMKADLLKHAARIREELKHPESYPTEREFKDAQEQAAFAERVANDPKVLAKAKRLFEVSHEHGRTLNSADVQVVARGVLDKAVAERSPLQTHAMSHMDARHVTEAEHAKLEADATQIEQAAHEHLGAAVAAERAAAEDFAKARAAGAVPQAVADRLLAARDARQAADTAWSAARDRRLRVSGRDPAKVAKHESIHAKAAQAKRRMKAAQAEHAKLIAQRQRLSGAQSVQRGGVAMDRMRVAAGAPTRARGVLAHIDEALRDESKLRRGAAAETKRAKKTAALDKKIAQATKARKAAEADYRKARAKAADSRLPPIRAGLRHPDGAFLSNDAIREHIRTGGGDPAAARDPATVAYVPHRIEAELRSSHHAPMAPGTRPNFAKGETRTGSLFRRGVAGHSRELLRDELARKATQTTKAEQLDRSLSDSGMRHPAWAKALRGEPLTKAEQRIADQGGYLTGTEGVDLSRRLKDATGEDWVPVRAFSASLRKSTQEMIRGEHQSVPGMETAHERLFNDRLHIDPKSKARNVVLQPASYVTALMKHLQPAGEVDKFFQILNGPFRMAVLPQPRWLGGNIAEPYVVRLPLTGSGANIAGLAIDFTAARRGLAALKRSGDPKVRAAAAEVEAHGLGGLFVGRRGASNRRTYEDFTGKTQKAFYGAHVVRNLPVVKQLGDLALAVPKMFFHANRYIESVAQHVAMGHQLRQDMQEFSGSYLKSVRLGQKAVDEAAHGLVDTPTQHRFMRMQHDLLGQYEGFPSWLRRLIQGPMPFLPWTLAAARFVFWTMPIHHPVTTALLIQSDRVVQQAWDDAHKRAGALPGMENMLIGADGGFTDIARFTPYGLTQEIVRGRWRPVTGQLMPQIEGTRQALEGKDPFGRDLQVPKTPGNPRGVPTPLQTILIALNQLAGSTTPDWSMVQHLREGGGTGYATSNPITPHVKPGSKHMSALRRTLDPGRPTYLRAPAGHAPQASGDLSPADRLLQGAAERAAGGGLSDAQLRLLERAAARAAGG